MAITNAMAPPPATSLISSPDFHCRNPIQAQPAPIAAHMSMYLIECACGIPEPKVKRRES